MLSKKIINLSFLLLFVNSYLFTIEDTNNLRSSKSLSSIKQNYALSYFIEHIKDSDPSTRYNIILQDDNIIAIYSKYLMYETRGVL